MLLEIAAAALALQAVERERDEVVSAVSSPTTSSDDYSAGCTLLPRIGERRDAALASLVEALAKVRS